MTDDNWNSPLNNSFSLRLQEQGENYSEYVFYILPEQVEIATPARLSLYQSISGQTHADHMGDGTTTINLQGNTGWMLGGLMKSPFAYASYVLLREMIFRYYKKCKEGDSNSKSLTLTMSFADAPDYGQWNVSVRELTLRRNANAPLLFNYQLSLVCLSENYFASTANERYPNQAEVMTKLKSELIPDSILHIMHISSQGEKNAQDLAPSLTFPYDISLAEMVKVAEARFSDSAWIVNGNSVITQTEEELQSGSGKVIKMWSIRELAKMIYGPNPSNAQLEFLARENHLSVSTVGPSKIKIVLNKDGDGVWTSIQDATTIMIPTESFDINYTLDSFNTYGLYDPTFANSMKKADMNNSILDNPNWRP